MTQQRSNAVARLDWRVACLVASALGLHQVAQAAITDVAQVPLVTSSASVVKPNLMFILDDSGSMDWDYMPDDANFSTGKYGFFAAQCNGLAYNPKTTYSLPVTATGTEYAAGSYTFPSPASLSKQHTITSTAPAIATGSVTVTLNNSNNAYSNGDIVTLYSSANTSNLMVGTVTSWTSGTLTLVVNVTEAQGSGTATNIGAGDSRTYYYDYTGHETKLGYNYTGKGVDTSTTFFRECDSTVGVTPGSGVFTRVVMTPSSTDLQNYRNWYTYYRTRILMMRSAASLAFKPIGDRYRVGFSTISTAQVGGTNFLDVADFAAAQKASFYSALFGASPNGRTPLRGALSKAGRYFAKKGTLANGSAQSYDPVQYSCQRNFAILTTDGYWNTQDETKTYGPIDLSGANVGEQDGANTPRPLNDGATGALQARTSTLQQRSVTTQYQTSTSTLQTRTGGRLQISTSANSGGNWTPYADTASCTWITTGTTRARCRYTGWSGWGNAGSCTANIGTGNSGTWTGGDTDCQYTNWTGYTNTPSCNALAQSTGPNYTVATATRCNTTVTNGAWTNAATCTTSATTGCQYTAWTSWTNVASCTAIAKSAASPYDVATATECQSVSVGQGSTDSLADVAMYYYKTDLRTPALNNCSSTVNGNAIDVCNNNVSVTAGDSANYQHLVTFTLGLGVSGTLRYQPDYLSAVAGDYHDIVQGTKDWPIPVENTETAVDDLWHAAVDGHGQYFSAGDPAALAKSLGDALAAITVQMGSGSGAAASTLQPVQGEDNKVFIAKYQAGYWNGDLYAVDIDPTTGAFSAQRWSAAQQLQAKVSAGTSRAIYYGKRSAGANATIRRDFTYASLSSDGLNGNFDNACSKTVALTQCATLTSTNVTAANLGSNMVDFLRGGANDAVYRVRPAGNADIPGSILGDIIGGSPVYVKKATFNYSENNYAGFIASTASRRGVVYAGSNDGMLHAFDGTTGDELWAYVPTMVMDRMYRLADADYGNRHEYFVNATPVIGDIYVPPVAPATVGAWKTILIGGLGAGGRGYYALDITDPNNPLTLWEFSNDSLGGANNLGQTFGNPVLAKRSDGTWVVAFTSGYNNVSYVGDLTPGDGVAAGDGNGHLFVINANTGARLFDIPTYTTGTTPAGTAASPSGLGKLNAWVDSDTDNTAKRFYAGDLLGNLWRFDVDNLVAPNRAALRLAYFSIGGVAQPITTQPTLAKVSYGNTIYAVVYVGTGRYLGSTDLGNTAVQSIYAIKDPLTNTPLGDAHASSTVVAQTLSLTTDPSRPKTERVTSNLAVDWSTGNGWRVDLNLAGAPGERVNVDMQLLNNTLTVAGNTPSTDVCVAGGTSYLYQLNIGTGNGTGKDLGDSMVVGISYVTLEEPGGGAGSGRTVTITVNNKGLPRTDDVPPPSVSPPLGRRTSWRELVN